MLKSQNNFVASKYPSKNLSLKNTRTNPINPINNKINSNLIIIKIHYKVQSKSINSHNNSYNKVLKQLIKIASLKITKYKHKENLNNKNKIVFIH